MDAGKAKNWEGVLAGRRGSSERRRRRDFLEAAQVCVGRDLPAAQVNRLQACGDLLYGLISGQGSESGDEEVVLQQMPEALGTHAREGVLDVDGATQLFDVLWGVWASDAFPAQVGLPVLLQVAVMPTGNPLRLSVGVPVNVPFAANCTTSVAVAP